MHVFGILFLFLSENISINGQAVSPVVSTTPLPLPNYDEKPSYPERNSKDTKHFLGEWLIFGKWNLSNTTTYKSLNDSRMLSPLSMNLLNLLIMYQIYHEVPFNALLFEKMDWLKLVNGSIIYGNSKLWMDQLRTYKNGTMNNKGYLAESVFNLPEINSGNLPMQREVDDFLPDFKLGDPKGAENIFALSLSIMWFRWHNYLAKVLNDQYNATSDTIFYEARRWTVAIQQSIYYNYKYQMSLGIVELKNMPKALEGTLYMITRQYYPKLNESIICNELSFDLVLHNILYNNSFNFLFKEKRVDNNKFTLESFLNKHFSKNEIDRIRNVTILDILSSVGELENENYYKQNKCIICPFKNVKRPNINKVPYSLLIIPIVVLIIFTIILILMRYKDKESVLLEYKNDVFNSKYTIYSVEEWIGFKYPNRRVFVTLETDTAQICVRDYDAVLLRILEFKRNGEHEIKLYSISDEPYIMIHYLHNYDLVIKCQSNITRETLLKEFEQFVESNLLKRQVITSFTLKSALKIAITKEQRQKLLEMFFRVGFSQAFSIEHSKMETLKVDDNIAKIVLHTELTLCEFAESLGMSPTNNFVQRMFHLVDKDQNNFISYREFIDLLILFADGSPEKKLKLLFDMYDINAIGYLTVDIFTEMIANFLDTVNAEIDTENIDITLKRMLANVKLENRQEFNFNDFKKIVDGYMDILNSTRLEFRGDIASHYIRKAREAFENIYGGTQHTESRNKIDEEQDNVLRNTMKYKKCVHFSRILNFIELNSKEIFWITICTLLVFGLFATSIRHYSWKNCVSKQWTKYHEISMSATNSIIFIYSLLLLTMCRNTITFLRSSIINNYFPFDLAINFHIYFALLGLMFTSIHVVGAMINFYIVSFKSYKQLNTLFKNTYYSYNDSINFDDLFVKSVTGFTGLVLLIICIIIYTFALPLIRKKLHNVFWYLHNLYPLFYIILILHGCGRLIQPPQALYYLSGPLILFIIDSLISINRKTIKIPIIKAQFLPSDVLMLEFQKPENFRYKSGQWIRIACLTMNKSEYHPFILTSAPHEPNLTVHIRAVGNWTRLIRNHCDKYIKSCNKLPKISLDGPFGVGLQDWNTYEVSILVGAGMGIAPFASILKDICYVSKTSTIQCKKIYFLWISKTQKQFEWLVDIIKNVEEDDIKRFISCHIFITEFYEKFDLRTIMLYICERYFQKMSSKSLFTNLRAVTHFGRPAFPQFFDAVVNQHQSIDKIGIFSCGPSSLTKSVDAACRQISNERYLRMEHHHLNF